MPLSKGRHPKNSGKPSTTRSNQPAPNPTWWAPVMVTLMVLGLLWIVIFYITAGAWPIGSFGYGNLVAGFGLLLAGFAMTMRWR